MQIKIDKPWTFTEIGRKPNNEDRIYPPAPKLGVTTRCFVLCDGMGGHENGEVAAEIVAGTLQPALMAGRTEPDVITRERFGDALAKTYEALDKMPHDTGKTPGTTMTCLYFADNGVMAAHIGDSRIYQIRPRHGVVFRTSDHSLVNELLKVGEITEEEARNFPRKNVITRAMQPGLEHPYKADLSLLTDIQGGDYFFMCSDGVLETVTDEDLVRILSSGKSDEDKLNAIYEICYGNTRDNYTCILIPVESVIGEPLPTTEDSRKDKVSKEITQPGKQTASAHSKEPDKKDPNKNIGDKGGDKGAKSAKKSDFVRGKLMYIIIIAMLFIIAVLLCLLFFRSPAGEGEMTPPVVKESADDNLQTNDRNGAIESIFTNESESDLFTDEEEVDESDKLEAYPAMADEPIPVSESNESGSKQPNVSENIQNVTERIGKYTEELRQLDQSINAVKQQLEKLSNNASAEARQELTEKLQSLQNKRAKVQNDLSKLKERAG